MSDTKAARIVRGEQGCECRNPRCDVEHPGRCTDRAEVLYRTEDGTETALCDECEAFASECSEGRP
jgi:hypothetical protein